MNSFQRNIYRTVIESTGNCFGINNPTGGSLTVEYTLPDGTQPIVGVSGGSTIFICSKIGTSIIADGGLIVTACGTSCVTEDVCLDCIPPTMQPIWLGYSGVDSATACTNIATPVVRYIPSGQDWMVVTFLYQDTAGTPANPGYYSDGAKWYLWDGSTFTATSFC